MKRSDHVPERRCAACGKNAAKGDMLRIMRVSVDDSTSDIAIDASGRGAGRGVYVCSAECLEKACKTRVFERALRMKIDPEAYERIREQGAKLL